jgi:chitinase
MSFAEIETRIKMYSLTAAEDEKASVKYMAFDQDQWVSWDDETTLQKKVDFANEQG